MIFQDNILNQSKWEREAKRRLATSHGDYTSISADRTINDSDSEPSETDSLLPGPRPINYTD